MPECVSLKSLADKRLEPPIRHDNWRRIPPNLLSRVQAALTDLEGASTSQALALPKFRRHPPTGDRAGFYPLRMDRLGRIVCHFEDGNVYKCGTGRLRWLH